MTMTNEPREESARASPERLICVTCGWGYTDAMSHVQTDTHLEAMARESVEEWLGYPASHPVAIGFAKQLARMEYFYYDYTAWRRAMGLPDTADTLLLARRIGWCWITAIGLEEFEPRMAYAREVIRIEIEGLPDDTPGKRKSQR